MSTDQDDLTRKQRREQAREQRKATEQAAAADAARRMRMIQLGVAVTIVVVAIVVILIATGGKSKSGIGNKHEQNATTAEVNSLVGGIPQSGNTLGDPKAPVTLQYFGDLECPFCKEFTLTVLPSIVPQWVRTGKLKIEYFSMSTATGGAESKGAEPQGTFNNQQVAAYAAGRQNKAWYFIETFYHEQGEEDSGYVTESYLDKIASQVPGLNLTQWTADRGDKALADQITADAKAASQNGFTGTPSFMIGKTGGTLQKLEPGSLTEAAAFNTAIEQVLKS